MKRQRGQNKRPEGSVVDNDNDLKGALLTLSFLSRNVEGVALTNGQQCC